jgi:hypothetical protein
MNKIFQIGFNRCGTMSLADFFSGNCLDQNRVVHWDYGRLAHTMYKNLVNNKNLLDGGYEHKIYFSDMECFFKDKKTKIKEWGYLYKQYKLLDEQYPQSKFILNTRDVDNWVNSRMNWLIWHEDKWQSYGDAMMDVFGYKSKEDMINFWRLDWYTHHIDVLNYFKTRPLDLLVYNIETDHSDKIINFFSSNLIFKHKEIKILNKSGSQKISKSKKPRYIELL